MMSAQIVGALAGLITGDVPLGPRWSNAHSKSSR